MKVKDLTFKIDQLKPRDPNHAVLAMKKNAGGPMRDKKRELRRGELKHKGRAYEDQDLDASLELHEAKDITPENVLAALPGTWTDVLDKLGYDVAALNGTERRIIQPILDQLAKDGKVSVRSRPAEDDVYSRKPSQQAIKLAVGRMVGDALRASKKVSEGLIVEASLGSRIPFDSYSAWKKAIPATASIDGDPKGLELARCVGKDFEGVCGKFDHVKKEGWAYKYYLDPKNMPTRVLAQGMSKAARAADVEQSDREYIAQRQARAKKVTEGRRHVYGKGDEILINHPNETMQAIGNGERVKVMTKSGVAVIEKVQFYNGGLMFKLDREVKLDDGSKSAWVSDRDVSLDLSKGAAPDAKTFAKRHAVGEEQLAEKWNDSGASDANGRWAKYAKGEIGVKAMAAWLIRSRVHKKTREEKVKSAMGAISQQQNTSKLITAKQADALRNAISPKDKK